MSVRFRSGCLQATATHQSEQTERKSWGPARPRHQFPLRCPVSIASRGLNHQACRRRRTRKKRRSDDSCRSYSTANEIALRPKTFAVLHCLIENSGRLVSKDEIFAIQRPAGVAFSSELAQSRTFVSRGAVFFALFALAALTVGIGLLWNGVGSNGRFLNIRHALIDPKPRNRRQARGMGGVAIAR